MKVNCKHYNDGYCYFKDGSTTKEFCLNMCEHFVDVPEDEIEECLGCDRTEENMCCDCCKDWYEEDFE